MGNIRVRDISEMDVKNFLDSLFAKQHLQLRTVKDSKAFLSIIMEQAIADNIILTNPVARVVINKKLRTKVRTEGKIRFRETPEPLILRHRCDWI